MLSCWKIQAATAYYGKLDCIRHFFKSLYIVYLLRGNMHQVLFIIFYITFYIYITVYTDHPHTHTRTLTYILHNLVKPIFTLPWHRYLRRCIFLFVLLFFLYSYMCVRTACVYCARETFICNDLFEKRISLKEIPVTSSNTLILLYRGCYCSKATDLRNPCGFACINTHTKRCLKWLNV